MSGLELATAVLVVFAGMAAQAQPPAHPTFDAFEVATIKPTGPSPRSRFITMQGHQFVARNHALKTLIAAAYNLTPRAILGGPSWIDSDRFDILAKPAGEVRPTLEEQMAMLRKLLADRFKLTFHREQKEFSIFTLTVARNGPKLREGTDPPEGPKPLVFVIYPQRAALPARNATMGEFASVLQRSALDRPVVDKTGLTGRYDFDLEWTPDESQFGGQAPQASEPTRPDLFTAMQEQLGLRLQATRGPIEAFMIDHAERPTEN
jgi:uncharacterized protein (TIGR03435 family)